jgi:hypothetical protein
VLFVSLSILSMAGGIPHLLQWVRHKPHLKITKATIAKQINDDFRYHVHLEVENQRTWWRRSGDASNVLGEYYIADKHGVQGGSSSDQLMSTYLLAGTKTAKDIEGYHTLSPEGNPYSIVFRIACNETAVVKQKIVYEAPS